MKSPGGLKSLLPLVWLLIMATAATPTINFRYIHVYIWTYWYAKICMFKGRERGVGGSHVCIFMAFRVINSFCAMRKLISHEKWIDRKTIPTAMHSHIQIVYFTIKRRKHTVPHLHYVKVKCYDLWLIHTHPMVCLWMSQRNIWKFKYERKYMCCH